MINKNIFILMLVMISLVGTISALSIPTAERCASVELIQFCPSCSYVNLSSITYPDNTIQYFNTEMTKNGSTYNYTFNSTCQNGDYVYFVEGDKDGTLAGESLPMVVTPTGETNNLALFLIMWAISVGLIIFGYVAEDYWLVIFGAFGMILCGLYIIIFGIVGIKDVAYTYSFGIITLMAGSYFGVRAAMEQLE